MNSPIFGPFQRVILVGIALVFMAALVTVGLSWREQRRLGAARDELALTLAFQERHRVVELQVLALETGPGSPTIDQVLQSVDRMIAIVPPDRSELNRQLETFRIYLMARDSYGEQALEQAIRLFHQIAMRVDQHEGELIARLHQESGSQLRYEIAAPIALLALVAIVAPIVRRRFVRPLEDFGQQITRLADGNFEPTPTDGVDTLMLPLHRNFLVLAQRLQALERDHREREASLEGKVRMATDTLLAQQRSLASSERLAVAGEMAASIAHEIRNPLAGIQMSLTNMRNETEDGDLADRLDTLISVVHRLARLVGEIVDAARHAPEPRRRVDVTTLVDELLELTRYQLPPTVRTESRIEHGLTARVPKDQLRQALLNLVLNAANAIGDREGLIEIEIKSQGPDICIEVLDDGPGFPPEVLEGGIRPFYSTRSQGTGLGLAMVRRFVRDLEGEIKLSNRSTRADRPGGRVALLLPSAAHHG
jgi:two-component system NtrC family sensor kinase